MLKSVADIFKSYGVVDHDGKHVNGTDKETNHRYGDAYEHILRGRRETAGLVMEVGVADGSSLLAWREVFPGATCVGMDIMPNPWAKLNGVDRVEFIAGNCRYLEDCRRATKGRQFNFICEDATHILEDTLLALFHLWPFVAPGGLYVIEEFANIGGLRDHVEAMWPFASVYDTVGPFGGVEPLVVLRKPLP